MYGARMVEESKSLPWLPLIHLFGNCVPQSFCSSLPSGPSAFQQCTGVAGGSQDAQGIIEGSLMAK